MELIGQRFGHIRVTDVVGQGGMGDVYGGYDEKLERRVALKALAPEQRLDAEARERLLREARALSKLDHPNICRIHDYIESKEADLLILEFIDGKTLGDLMATSMPRAEKLRICQAVASVLVAAHRAGIVHRDLKPENVMLTKTGEVKVLDFGLARWLQRARTQSSIQQMPAPPIVLAKPSDVTAYLPRELESGPMETAAGIAMGTPLYMSPEQARGEVLTPASDMFSFGLLMQALFTGNDPHPMGLSARDVILRVALGETNAVEGVPGDVAALINRLKQFAPADRPTAVEAVERLQFMTEKPQRIARRGAAAAVAALLALGGWRYTVDLKTERTKALRSEADAVKRRREVEDLLEFMLGDLRPKLDRVGQIEVLDGVAQRALAYIESSDPGSMTIADLARNSKALIQIGEVRIAQGKLTEALQLFERSLSLTRLGLQREPASEIAHLGVATSHFWIADVYRRQGKSSDALNHYTQYLSGAEHLARTHPANPEYQRERAYGHSSVAAAHELRGEYDLALKHLYVTRKIAEERVRESPRDTARQADLARNHNRIGFVLQRAGDLKAARENYEQEFAIYSALVRTDPRDSRWKESVVTTHDFLARVGELTGDSNAALVHYRSALNLIRSLNAQDPLNTLWRRHLAVVQMKFGDMLRIGGQLSEASTSIAEAERILEDLVATDEATPALHRDLAVARTIAARLHLARGDAAEAERSAAAALRLLQSGKATGYDTPRYLAACHVVLGDARAAAGDRSRGEAAWSDAVAILASEVQKEDSPESLDLMARALVHLGRRAEATPFIERLQRAGYRAPDYVKVIQLPTGARPGQSGRAMKAIPSTESKKRSATVGSNRTEYAS